MGQNFSASELNKVLNKLSKNPDMINKMSEKTPEEMIKKLSPEQANKLNDLMKNEKLKQQLLNSPQAKMLMKMLEKGKGGN